MAGRHNRAGPPRRPLPAGLSRLAVAWVAAAGAGAGAVAAAAALISAPTSAPLTSSDELAVTAPAYPLPTLDPSMSDPLLDDLPPIDEQADPTPSTDEHN